MLCRLFQWFRVRLSDSIFHFLSFFFCSHMTILNVCYPRFLHSSNTYVEHTKCITELERYSGSNFTPKSSSNKGERKQNSWINIVRTVLDRPTLSQNQRELLRAISNFENVPRKKAKFQVCIRFLTYDSCRYVYILHRTSYFRILSRAPSEI